MERSRVVVHFNKFNYTRVTINLEGIGANLHRKQDGCFLSTPRLTRLTPSFEFKLLYHYQTIPPANAPKDEPSAMVGTALVAGYSYGANTNPAMIDIATTTTTANLVRGGDSNGDNSFAEIENEDCLFGPCNKNRNEKACMSGTFTKGCNWYPHYRDGVCSSCSGVNCGNHRAPICSRCNWYGPVPSNPFKTNNKGKKLLQWRMRMEKKISWQWFALPPMLT